MVDRAFLVWRESGLALLLGITGVSFSVLAGRSSRRSFSRGIGMLALLVLPEWISLFSCWASFIRLVVSCTGMVAGFQCWHHTFWRELYVLWIGLAGFTVWAGIVSWWSYSAGRSACVSVSAGIVSWWSERAGM